MPRKPEKPTWKWAGIFGVGFCLSIGTILLAQSQEGTVVAWGTSGLTGVPNPPYGFIKVAGNGSGVLALKADGSIVGPGTSPCTTDPTNHTQLHCPNSGFVDVAGGVLHRLALRSDGSIEAWGATCGNDADKENEAPPGGYHDFVAISAGECHSLGLRSNGSVVAWGNPFYYGDDAPQMVPPCNSDFVAISDGGDHWLGLKSDGRIVGWGAVYCDPTTNTHSVDQIGSSSGSEPFSDYIAVAAGDYFSLGLRADGTIVAWGYDDNGVVCGAPGRRKGYDLNNQTVACNEDGPGEAGFIAISAGVNHAIALRSDGSIYAWGLSHGQAYPPTPNSGFIAISASELDYNVGLRRYPNLISSVPADEKSLWRTQKNIIRLTFDLDLPSTPSTGQIVIRELLSGGSFGSDISSGFTFACESDNTVVKIQETASSFQHRHWYEVSNLGSWAAVTPFGTGGNGPAQYVVQMGDVDNSGRVQSADVGTIYGSTPYPCTSGCGDANRNDVDGNLLVNSDDVNAVNAKVPSLTVAKPSEH